MSPKSRNSRSSAGDTAEASIASSGTVVADVRAAKREWSGRLLVPAPRVAAAATGAVSIRARGVTAAVSPRPNKNVVGVGVAEKVVEGRATGALCVKFFVRVKYADSQLSRSDKLPSTVNGVPVDVEQVGMFRKFAAKRAAGTMPDPQARRRPAQPGSSIGFQDPSLEFVMAGTFGALVKSGAHRYILSNNHVLADENQLPIGSAIFQPGLLDHGKVRTDEIATLSKLVRLRANVNNRVDAAIAEIHPLRVAIADILYIGKPTGKTAAAIDMIVHKFGRTTSYRAGRVTSVDTDVSVQYDTGTYTFAEQIIIKGLNNQSFSDSGDSGSLILERATNRAVGLLFAGSSAYTIANHITTVLTKLGGISLA